MKGLAVKYETLGLQDLEIGARVGTFGRRTSFLKVSSGDEYACSQRFWGSFCSRFQISETVFNYFSHEEVMKRIVDVVKGDGQVRICLVDNEGKKEVMALTNPASPVINPADLELVLKEGKGTDLSYSNGSIRSNHFPKGDKDSFVLGANTETFQRRFMMESPIDGYGKPKVFLEMLREVCSNGAVAMSPSFRTDITIGKNPYPMLRRAISSFDNEDGFAALKSRFTAAQNSPASINECLQLFHLLEKITVKMDRAKLLEIFKEVTGNVANMYGLANENVLSEKKQRVLPSKCRVYDLLNFASEVATHKAATTHDADRLHAFNGDIITRDYDLEETAKGKVKFQGRFLKASNG